MLQQQALPVQKQKKPTLPLRLQEQKLRSSAANPLKKKLRALQKH